MRTARRGLSRVKAVSLILCVCLLACAAQAGTPVLNWAAQVGGGTSEEVTAVSADANNVYFTGPFSGTADIDPSSGVHNVAAIGTTDVYVTKTDADGDFVWGVSIGGLNEERSQGIAVDSSGSVLVTGFFSGTVDFDPGIGVANRTSTGDYDLFVLKLSKDGEFVWVKALGGSDDDLGNSIAVDTNDNVYVCGRFAGSVNFNPNGNGGSVSSNGMNDLFSLKLKSSGEFDWVAAAGGENIDEANSLAIDADGNVLIVGYFYNADLDPGPGEFILETLAISPFVLKLTPKGKFVFAVKAEPEDGGTAFSVATDSENSIFVAGEFEGLTDFNPGAGIFNLTSNANFGDTYVLKLNASGEFQFARATDGPDLTWGLSISLDQFGNCFVGGRFTDTVDFDPSGATALLTSAGSEDAFLLQLDKFGNYVWAGKMGSTGNDILPSVCTDRAGNVLAGGKFSGTVDFDPNAGTEQLTATGFDGFLTSFKYLQRGDVTVKLKPKAARRDGARWRLDDDPTFRKSGAVVEDVLEGTHTISFKTISDWTKPNDKEIVVDPNVTNSTSAKYKR